MCEEGGWVKEFYEMVIWGKTDPWRGLERPGGRQLGRRGRPGGRQLGQRGRPGGRQLGQHGRPGGRRQGQHEPRQEGQQRIRGGRQLRRSRRVGIRRRPGRWWPSERRSDNQTQLQFIIGPMPQSLNLGKNPKISSGNSVQIRTESDCLPFTDTDIHPQPHIP
jgi:hypothetical protein